MTTEKLANSRAVIAFLAEKFPACFSEKGEAKPLKIGVFQDLAERLADEECVSKTQLRQALRHYTNSWRYLSCVKAGSKRIDLDGNEGDEIEQQHADHAAQELAASKQKFAERKAKDAADKKPKKAAPKGKYTSRPKSDKNRNKNTVKKDGLSPATETILKVGTAVNVKLGRIPAKAVITEIEKSDIYVQLDSGMVVKTTIDKLYV